MFWYVMRISDFRSEKTKNCALLGHYATNSGNVFYRRFGTNCWPIFRGQESKRTRKDYLGFLIPEDKGRFGFLTPEDGTDGLSRNVGKKLPVLAV
jgi:hypothetical protein